jgi:DNA-binding FadR family transcriptional regulator
MPVTLLKLNVRPLPSVNRAEEVARALREQIRSRALETESRLPSEQMMALQFGVSRW